VFVINSEKERLTAFLFDFNLTLFMIEFFFINGFQFISNSADVCILRTRTVDSTILAVAK
jgi:hypothetical protein